MGDEVAAGVQDYDELADAYAAHRGAQPVVVERLIAVGGVGAASRVLEIGCGTGNYIGAIAAATGCMAHAVDISRRMLAVARERCPAVAFAERPAEALAMDDDAFDLVYSIDVIHHLRSAPDHYREAYRVLVAEGRLCSVTHSHELIGGGSVLARYFPETIAANRARYPALAELRDWVGAAGFRDVTDGALHFPVVVCDAALYAEKADSTLHLIGDEAFRRGLAALEADLARGPVEGEHSYLVLWATK